MAPGRLRRVLTSRPIPAYTSNIPKEIFFASRTRGCADPPWPNQAPTTLFPGHLPSAVHDGVGLGSAILRLKTTESRIEQAKGVLAERRQISVDEAFGLLREYARSHNLRLSEWPVRSPRARRRPPSCGVPDA